MKRIRGTTKEVEQVAKELRSHLTPAESLLWEKLRSKQLNGLKFRCQHPVDRFILDFYCPSLKLVIEIDGSSHDDRHDYDQARTEELELYGYNVIRFTNQQVFNNLEEVLNEISSIAEVLAPLPPTLGE